MNQRVTVAADIYSYGVLIWEICTGETPIRGQLRPVQAPEEAPQDIVDLIDACLQVSAKQRPTIRLATAHCDLLMSAIICNSTRHLLCCRQCFDRISDG